MNLRLKSSTIALLYLLITVTLSACEQSPPVTDDVSRQHGFAGAATCETCHAEEAARWRGSHHDLAIQPATRDTVLGNFADAEYSHNNVTSRFFIQNEQFLVETDGADGKLATFPVRYTFGVTPLQQYLVELPNGKLQALSIAWDSRSAQEGGQKWFHVYGDDPIDHTDVLHWTRFSQNWETMCADCHSTNLLSEYNLEQDRFSTTWAELDVSCEACHGAGAQHVAWARDNPTAAHPAHAGFEFSFDERRNVTWALDTATGNSKRSKTKATSVEIDACAGCHSRRARIADSNNPAEPFLDNYSPALIDPPLYYADGQMHDEVYVYGSFLQSKMHQAGVTCSDCHDPHSLELRAPGPAVCLQCHAAEKFNTVQHQLHTSDTANCIDCHMPSTTYMQNDSRSDHSLRIPRPELSVEFGVPNACNNCHTDRDAAWAADALQTATRLNLTDTQNHWSYRLAAATSGNAPPQSALRELATDISIPAIIRGTAAARLRVGDSPETRQLLTELTGSSEPLLRFGAAQALQNSDPVLAAHVAPALLNDPLRALRITAAESLAGVDPTLLPAGSNPQVQRAVAEYLASQAVNNERPESHANIGNLRRKQRRLDLAESAYRQAMKLNPSFVPAYANLADLYREWNREGDAESTLRDGLNAIQGDAFLHHALGLSLIRQNRLVDALPELRVAAESADATPRYALVFALALDESGDTAGAEAYLRQAIPRFANDPELMSALQAIEAKL